MVKFFVVALLAVIAVFVYLNFFNQTMFESEGQATIGIKAIDVEIAESAAEQFTGLSGRDSICEDCGMIFLYSQAKIQKFTMRGMRFPLDIIFIRDGKITEIFENVPFPRSGELPINVTSRDPADMVLEVNAGFVEKNHVPVGQTVSLTR